MTSANHLLSLPNNTHRHWWRDKSLRQNVLHCAGCCLCVFYLGYDQALLAALQAIPEWNAYFDTPTGTKLGLIASSLYFPGLIASFFGSWVSMRYGRKPTVGIGSALIIIGTIVNALAKNTGVFCGGRVLIGAGGAITKVSVNIPRHANGWLLLRPYSMRLRTRACARSSRRRTTAGSSSARH